MTEPALIVSAAALVLALAGPVLVALARLSWSQVELRTATLERRMDVQAAASGDQSTRLAVVTSQHDGMAATLRRVEAKIDRMMGRNSEHQEE